MHSETEREHIEAEAVDRYIKQQKEERICLSKFKYKKLPYGIIEDSEVVELKNKIEDLLIEIQNLKNEIATLKPKAK